MNKNHKIILSLLSLAILLVVLDSAITNVALPVIKKALHFDASVLQWVLTSYILTFGGFLMLGGRTADLFGRKRILIGGIAGFTFFSFLIGFSLNGTMFIVLRALQGLAAAFMAPTALSILLATFDEGEERNKALSIWSIVASGGAALGVFLGGLLTQTLGWQWCFFVNVPIGIAAIFGILKYIPEYPREFKGKNLDLPGALFVTSGLIALVYGLTLAVRLGWTASSTIISFGISLVLLMAFIFNESRVKHPLVPLSIFRIRNVVGGNLIMLPIVAGALGMFFFLSLYIQNVLRFSPVISGLCFLPIPFIIGIISYNAPQLLKKYGFKPLVITGIGLTALGTFMNTFLGSSSAYFTQILPSFIILALGFGISFVSITVAATTGVPPDESGLAAGLINTSQQIGSALGLAILAVVANSTTKSAIVSGISQTQATIHGYQQAFLTAAILMTIALIIAIFTIRTPRIKNI